MSGNDVFRAQVEAALDVVRDALGRVEEAAQQEDDPKWHVLSRRFAVLVSPMRDYLNGLQLGRDLPHNLARRLEPALAELDQDRNLVGMLGLTEHVEAVRGLAREAASRS